jgi:predicted metalloprotease
MTDKKTILIALLCVCAVVLLLGCNSEKQIKTPVTDFEWKFYEDNSHLWIKGYKGKSSEIAIPQKINIKIGTGRDKRMFEVPVLGIDTNALRDRGLTRVVIPEGIKYIGAWAFYKNNIVSVSLPSTLVHIDQSAFWGNKLESVNIPDGITAIESGVFSYNRLSSVRLPNTLSHIGSRAFEGNNLTSITIPEKITEISEKAFADNPLKEICVKAKRFRLLIQNVFNPPLFGVLPQGTYVLVDGKNWLFQEYDGNLLPLQSYYEKLIKYDPGILADLVYVAVKYADIEMIKQLLKHASRPLSHEDYRLLIGLGPEKRNSIWYGDEGRDDPLGFDEIVLEDIRNGFLNPMSKDANGKDIFDYAATTGTAELMKGLLPYLRWSGRTILTVNSAGISTGLYVDAVNAGNLQVASVLFPYTWE